MKEPVRPCFAQGTKSAIKMPGRSPLQLLLIQTQDPPADARVRPRGSRILAQSPERVGAIATAAARHEDARVSALNLLQGAIEYVLAERTRYEHDIDRWVSLVDAGNILVRAARTIRGK